MAVVAFQPVMAQAQIARDLSTIIDAAYETDQKKIVYKNDIVTLVVCPSQGSAIRGHFKRDEVVFAYRGTKNVWYQAPIQVQDTGDQTIVYHSDFPRDKEPPEYTSFLDKKGRKYLLVPANGAFVPVRHGTDPIAGNWLSPDSPVKIVYDSKGFRHPAMDIDYTIHGMKLYGRFWWPSLNGPFKHSYKRIRLPYLEDFEQLDVPQQGNALQNGLRLVLLLAGFKIGAPAAAGQAFQPGRIALRYDLENPVRLQQAFGPEAQGDAFQHQRDQDRRRQDYPLQRNILDALNEQESREFSHEVAQALQANVPFEEFQALFQQGAFLRVEDRGMLAKKAVQYEKAQELGVILDSGEIPQEDLGELLIESVRKEKIDQVQQILREGRFIPDEKYSQAVIFSAKFGYSDILKALLARNILDVARGQAAIEAVVRGSDGDLDLLLQNGPIPIEKRGEAAVAACRQSEAMLRKILHNGPLLIEHRGKATIESVELGKYGHMQLLIAGRNPISEADRGRAAIAAARKGKMDVIGELGNTGHIAQNDREEIYRLLQQYR